MRHGLLLSNPESGIAWRGRRRGRPDRARCKPHVPLRFAPGPVPLRGLAYPAPLRDRPRCGRVPE